MRLSEGVEWALHAAVLLAMLPPDMTMTASRLAEFHGVPPAYMAKHLQAMTRAGILTAGAGRRGGYRLARPADQITALDVVLAIEGDEEAFRCTEIRRRGPSASPATAYPLPCNIHRTMQAAETAYRAALRRHHDRVTAQADRRGRRPARCGEIPHVVPGGFDMSTEKHNVFVAGATGEVGRTALAALVAAGHTVTGVARTPEKAALVRKLGATPVTVDLFDGDAVKDATVGHDTIVHVATKIPPTSKGWRKSAWAENNRLRTDATRVLVDAALANGVETFIMESISFLYVDGGDRWLDEDTPFGDVGLQQSMLDAEAATGAFTQAGGRGIVLRFGLFYGPDAIHTKDMVRAAKHGIAGLVGDPAGYASSIHIEDAGRAVAAALDAPAGTYNIVDDEPVTKTEYAAILGEAVGRKKAPRTVGPLLAKAGGQGVAVLARSYRVSNKRFRDATGWAPRWKSVRDGMPVVIEEVLKDA